VKNLKFKAFYDKYAVCRLAAEDEIPDWVKKDNFYSITKTLEELSIVCFQGEVPEGVPCERDWKVLKIDAVLDFSLIGILSKVSKVLAEAGISIFAVSTYNTDYILIKDKDFEKAVKSLEVNGHTVEEV
jgi:uncharacterized protein